MQAFQSGLSLPERISNTGGFSKILRTEITFDVYRQQNTPDSET